MFLVHVRKAHKQNWLNNALRNKVLKHRCRYKLQSDWRQDSALAAALKKLVSCYVQFKSDHAAIEAHLTHIKAQDSSVCTHCRAINELVHYALLKYRK